VFQSNQIPVAPLLLNHSTGLLHRAQAVVPGITHSMMKRPEQFAPGAFPAYLKAGSGAEVVDVDENRYVDFICGLGASSLGYRHPKVEEAMMTALETGYLHSLPTELEVDVAEAVVEAVPGADMARFFKTGADATSAAVRLARAITGRDGIIVVGYNGWHDQFMFDTPGVPNRLRDLTRRVPLMSPDSEASLLEILAEGSDAAILLTIPYNRVLSRQFVQQMREACTTSGTLLILDEIVTGFRLGPGGVSLQSPRSWNATFRRCGTSTPPRQDGSTSSLDDLWWRDAVARCVRRSLEDLQVHGLLRATLDSRKEAEVRRQ
jgi:aminotransferase MxcL